MCVNKVKWSPKGTKIILSDKTHAIIALPGFDFMQLAQQPGSMMTFDYNHRPDLLSSGASYLGNTASKLLQPKSYLESSPNFYH